MYSDFSNVSSFSFYVHLLIFHDLTEICSNSCHKYYSNNFYFLIACWADFCWLTPKYTKRQQNKWLVSTWNATLCWNRLTSLSVSFFATSELSEIPDWCNFEFSYNCFYPHPHPPKTSQTVACKWIIISTDKFDSFHNGMSSPLTTTGLVKPMQNRIYRLKVFYEKLFLNILQNSQESTCVGVCFLIKLQASGMQLYWKTGSD